MRSEHYVTPEMRREKRGLRMRAEAVAEEAMALYWRTHERLLTPSDKSKIRSLYTRAVRIVNEAARHEYVQRSGIPFEVRDLEHARRELHEAKTEHGLHTRRALNSIVASMNALRQFAQRIGARDQSRRPVRGAARRTTRQRDPLSTKFRGVEVIGNTTVVKVDVYDGSRVIDGAWGQVHEIDAWLKRKGYPAMAWSKVPKRKPTALQKHLTSRSGRDQGRARESERERGRAAALREVRTTKARWAAERANPALAEERMKKERARLARIARED